VGITTGCPSTAKLRGDKALIQNLVISSRHSGRVAAGAQGVRGVWEAFPFESSDVLVLRSDKLAFHTNKRIVQRCVNSISPFIGFSLLV